MSRHNTRADGLRDYRLRLARELASPPSEARIEPNDAAALGIVPSGPMSCPDCHGRGYDPVRGRDCDTCDGTGWS